MYFNPVESLLNIVATHRSMADLAKCEEARVYHETWASWYERWAEMQRRRRVDFSAITRDVASMRV